MQPILVPSLAALLLFASSGAPRPRGSSPDKPVDLVLTHGQTLRGTIHARSIRIPSSARVIVSVLPGT